MAPVSGSKVVSGRVVGACMSGPFQVSDLRARTYVSRACGGNQHAATCFARTDSGGQCSTAGVAMGGTVSGGSPGTVSDRKSTRLNSSHLGISYAVFCLKK